MFVSPYDTTAGRMVNIKSTHDQLLQYYITHGITEQLMALPHNDGVDKILLFKSGTSGIPYWTHPLELVTSQGVMTVVDVRGFTRVTREGHVEVTSQLDYDLAVLRAHLQKMWAQEAASQILGFGNIQVQIFSRWMTEGLMYAYNIDQDTQTKVTMIAGVFFLCQFEKIDSEGVIPKEFIHRWSIIIGKAISMNVGAVYDLIADLPPMNTLSDFITVTKEHTGSISLEEMTIKAVFEVLGKSWFGYQAVQLVTAAIEYPPIFAALIYTAIQERGYRNARLSTTVKRYDSRGTLGTEFVKSLNHAVDHL